MKISKNIYQKIIHCFPDVPPEAGGILGRSKDGVIVAFHFDPGKGNVDATRAIYTPNISRLNQQIKIWASNEIQFCGIIHSHPPKAKSLSKQDIEFINTIMYAMPNHISFLYFPVVFPHQRMICFRADRHNPIMICEENIEII